MNARLHTCNMNILGYVRVLVLASAHIVCVSVNVSVYGYFYPQSDRMLTHGNEKNTQMPMIMTTPPARPIYTQRLTDL